MIHSKDNLDEIYCGVRAKFECTHERGVEGGRVRAKRHVSLRRVGGRVHAVGQHACCGRTVREQGRRGAVHAGRRGGCCRGRLQGAGGRAGHAAPAGRRGRGRGVAVTAAHAPGRLGATAASARGGGGGETGGLERGSRNQELQQAMRM